MPLPKAAKGQPAPANAAGNLGALAPATWQIGLPAWQGYSNTYISGSPNVLWQDTSSSASYLSAASALSATAKR